MQDRVLKLGPSTGLCNFSPPVSAGGVLGGKASGKRLADLRLTAAAPKRVKRGARFTIRLRIANRGPATAHRVLLTDKLSRSLRLVGVRASAKQMRCGRNRASVKSADLDPAPGNNRARTRTRGR